MTATVNFSVANTTDWRLTLNLTRDGGDWDLSGYSARMQMRSPAASDTPAVELSTEAETIVLDGSTLRIAVPRALALGVPAGSYAYDIVLSDDLETVRAIAGTATVIQGVTR
ncbi:MAG: hypothetical protein R3184_01905 [Aurantimonas coralicida]|nr:hypothetical protein [Aurantimonas coralicida]